MTGSGVIFRHVNGHNAILTAFPARMAPHNIHFCSLLVILDKNVLKNLRGQKMPTVLHKDTDYWRVSKSQLWQTFQNQPSRSPKGDAQKSTLANGSSTASYDSRCRHRGNDWNPVRHTTVTQSDPHHAQAQVQVQIC